MVDYQTALKQLTNKSFCKTPKWRAQQGRANRMGVYRCPKKCSALILDFERAMIADCRRRGIPMFAHCVMRTELEQERLFKEGRSKARAGNSPHNHGMAVDIIHSVEAWNLDRRAWDILGHIGFEVSQRIGVPVEWGGDWDFYDPAHWQLKNWRDLL